MASQARLKANAKYHEKFDVVRFRVPKGDRDKFKNYAESQGLSLNQLLINLIQDDMKKHGAELDKQQEET